MKNISTSNNLRLEIVLFALVSILAALVFLANLGNYPLFNPDEGLYAEPAREMLDTGEYITTTLNYTVRFTKPPLIIWAMALCYKVFGVDEFAARFFCATSGFLLTIFTYLFASKYLGRRIAIYSAAMLLTSPLFVGVGRMAITDMPLSCFTAGGLFAFFHGWKQKKTFWLYIGYLLTAFAVMTKGPVGLFLPGVILGIYFSLRGEIVPAVKFFRLPLGMLTVAAISLPWFVIEIAVTHGAYFQEFIMRENFARFTSVVDSHKGPWWYHIAAVLGGLFPWSILLPQALITMFKNFSNTQSSQTSKPDFKVTNISSHFSKWMNSIKHLNETDDVLFFALVWSVLIIAFFSASVSKLLPYTLPAFPALAIIIAYQCETLLMREGRKNMFVYGIILTLIYAIALLICPTLLKHLRNSPPELIGVLYQYCAFISVSILISLLILLSKRKALSLAILFTTNTLTTIVFVPKFLHVMAESWEQAASQYAKFAKYSQQPLIVYKLRKPSLTFYYGKRVLQPANRQELLETINTGKRYYLITSTKYLPEIDLSNYKVIDKNNNIAFLFISK